MARKISGGKNTAPGFQDFNARVHPVGPRRYLELLCGAFNSSRNATRDPTSQVHFLSPRTPRPRLSVLPAASLAPHALLARLCPPHTCYAIHLETRTFHASLAPARLCPGRSNVPAASRGHGACASRGQKQAPPASLSKNPSACSRRKRTMTLGKCRALHMTACAATQRTLVCFFLLGCCGSLVVRAA